MGPPSGAQYFKYSILRLLLAKSWHHFKLKCKDFVWKKRDDPHLLTITIFFYLNITFYNQISFFFNLKLMILSLNLLIPTYTWRQKQVFYYELPGEAFIAHKPSVWGSSCSETFRYKRHKWKQSLHPQDKRLVQQILASYTDPIYSVQGPQANATIQ